MTRIAKFILFFLILALMSISALEFRFKLFHEAALKGYFTRIDAPALKYFTWRRWFSGDFQQVTTTRLNEHTGLRSSLIRVGNQVDFTLFGSTHAKGFLLGKNRCLFEEDYIHEYTGQYFIGTSVINRKLSRLKNVADSLAHYHIPLVLVLEPGKASFYPEYIPDRFHPGRRGETNYEGIIRRVKEIGISCLDLNRYFLLIKDTCRYPLFPPYGMHWSMYGVQLAVDTLCRYIGGITGKPMPEFRIQSLRHSENSLWTDYDIGDLLNLACPMKSTPGVYPMIPFHAIPDGTLSALVVADSYYLNLVETYGKKMFGRQDYWYYNSNLYPHQNDVPATMLDKNDLRSKLKEHNIVLLMVSEINLHCCFWNFADEAFLAFHPEIKDSRLDDFENAIRFDREWFRFMVKKSVEQKRPLEQVIRNDAEYMFLSNYSDIQGKGRQDTIEYLRLVIKNNPEWMANLTKRAKDRNIPVDSLMLLDATYSYDQSKKKP